MDMHREGPRNARVYAGSGNLNDCPQQDELHQALQCPMSWQHCNNRIARADGETICIPYVGGGSYDRFSYDWPSVYLQSGDTLGTNPPVPSQYMLSTWWFHVQNTNTFLNQNMLSSFRMH
jgi:hypothetical protein